MWRECVEADNKRNKEHKELECATYIAVSVVSVWKNKRISPCPSVDKNRPAQEAKEEIREKVDEERHNSEVRRLSQSR